MNKTLLIILLFYSSFINPSRSRLQKIFKGNLFRKVNIHVQNITNNIFKLLQLNKNFTNVHQRRLLLSMHTTMNSISEKNYMVYKDIKRIVNLFLKIKPKGSLFKIDELIKILAQEKLTPDNLNVLKRNPNKNVINLELPSWETSENKEEAFAFLKEYFNNIKGNYDNIDSTLQKIKNQFEINKHNVRKRRILKAWKLPNISEEVSSLTNFRRIFQGTKVTIRLFPFLVSVHVNGKYVCAGSIINTLMIITAAVCLQTSPDDSDAINVTVRVGSNYTDAGGKICQISRIFIHPRYNPDTLDNNLAILELEDTLEFTNKPKIRRIDYQRMEGDLHSSVTDIVIAGWGDTNANDYNENQPLAFSHLDVYDRKRCNMIYTSKFVHEKNFCAGFTSVGSGACQGDQGGPAIAGNVLIGVVSFGPHMCGTADAPTVFTNLGYYIEWIESVLSGMPSTSSFITPSYSVMRFNMPRRTKSYTKTSKVTIQPKDFTIERTSQNTQYPKAFKILTYVLNGLLSAEKNVDNVVVREDNRDDTDTVKENMNNAEMKVNYLRDGPGELMQDIKSSHSTTKKNSGMYKSKMNSIQTETSQEDIESEVELTQRTSTPRRELKRMVSTTTTSPEPLPKSENFANKVLRGINPLLLAIKGIQMYLGLDKVIQISEVSKTDSKENDERSYSQQLIYTSTPRDYYTKKTPKHLDFTNNKLKISKDTAITKDNIGRDYTVMETETDISADNYEDRKNDGSSAEISIEINVPSNSVEDTKLEKASNEKIHKKKRKIHSKKFKRNFQSNLFDTQDRTAEQSDVGMSRRFLDYINIR